jgi:hypothetical protein
MNRTILNEILIVIFLITTVVAVFAVVYSYQLATERVEVATLGDYSLSGEYTYEAVLVPNLLYNTTLLRQGEGTLFQPLVNSVAITFNYLFTSSPSATRQSLDYRVIAQLSSQKYNKTLTPQEADRWLVMNSSTVDFTCFLNTSLLSEVFATLDSETGSISSEKSIILKPVIFQTAEIEGRNITEVFTPQLKISYLLDAGSYISIQPLTSSKSGSITQTDVIQQPGVSTTRFASVIGLAISAIALLASVALFMRRPRRLEAPVDKEITANKDMIINTMQTPQETKIVVEMSTFGDLAKTADILARPILRFASGSTQVFFVLDGETKYQFVVTR